MALRALQTKMHKSYEISITQNPDSAKHFLDRYQGDCTEAKTICSAKSYLRHKNYLRFTFLCDTIEYRALLKIGLELFAVFYRYKIKEYASVW